MLLGFSQTAFHALHAGELWCVVAKVLGVSTQDYKVISTVEGGELGCRYELGQNFSDSSPLLLLIKGHWCAIL